MNPKVIENFVSDEDCQYFIEFFDELADKGIITDRHTNENDGRSLVWNLDNPIFNQYAKKYFDIIADLYDGPEKLYPHIVGLYRYGIGPGLGDHIDIMNDGCSECKMSGIIYFNDNYEGGEIWFPNLNFEVKPPKGSLIYYPAFGEEYRHGVRAITSGYRYAIPTCFTTDIERSQKHYL